MCGITGFWQPTEEGAATLLARARAMAEHLEHRGPDDHAEWADERAGFAVGFRRLAIVELSPLGRQPMYSESGRYVIAFNGEVYNFGPLREELASHGHRFQGHSDTEVMLAAIEEWGLPAAVKRFIGMFAFALWDREERALHLVRDRLGIKPLYYGQSGDTLLFGSELKALRAHPAFRPRVDRSALGLLLRQGYIPTPLSIYQGIGKLPPGTILTLRAPDDSAEPVPFWSAREIALRGAARPFAGSDTEATELLEALLRDAVRLRMIADVPIGAFLSGGIDSSLVAALMQAQSARPVKTFSIGFHETGYNEATHAAAVARHLGTDHTELYVTPGEAQGVIPRLPLLYDEPFADSSQIPTFLVSQLARRQVTVSLSGDGGDELFAGYDRYLWSHSLWQTIGRVPPLLRRVGARSIGAITPATWDWGLRQVRPLLPGSVRQRASGQKMRTLASVLAVRDADELYRNLFVLWPRTDLLVGDEQGDAEAMHDRADHAEPPHFLQRMMLLDLVTYLPDDILTKVDRASMATSLEARVPLLDHRVAEFAATLPLAMKVRGGQGKWLLRQVLYRHVPQQLVERPKMGFAVPIGAWLRGPLREWAESLLDERRLREQGYLQPASVRQKWAEHLAGEANWQYPLWALLQFQAWLEHWG